MNERLTTNPQFDIGACVAGTDVPVQKVLDLVHKGLSSAEIVRDYYPQLKPEDIRACYRAELNRLMPPYTDEELESILGPWLG